MAAWEWVWWKIALGLLEKRGDFFATMTLSGESWKEKKQALLQNLWGKEKEAEEEGSKIGGHFLS